MLDGLQDFRRFPERMNQHIGCSTVMPYLRSAADMPDRFQTECGQQRIDLDPPAEGAITELEPETCP